MEKTSTQPRPKKAKQVACTSKPDLKLFASDDSDRSSSSKKDDAPSDSSFAETLDITEARLARKRLEHAIQQQCIEEECKNSIANLEVLANERAEAKRRVNEYRGQTVEMARFQPALDLLDVQMPTLVQLRDKGDSLKTKLERFTDAMQGFLSRVMVVNSKNVNVPKTEEEMSALTSSIAAMNVTMGKLCQTLGVDESNEDEMALAAIFADVSKAMDLFFESLEQHERIRILKEIVERLKVSEDFVKHYLDQSKRRNEMRFI